MAKYFAIVNGNYIQKDIRTGQIELYEEESHAQKACCADLIVIPVEVIKSEKYEQLQKENAGLKDELAELELKNHNLIADTYNLKAEAVREFGHATQFDLGQTVYEAAHIYAARLEGDK